MPVFHNATSRVGLIGVRVGLSDLQRANDERKLLSTLHSNLPFFNFEMLYTFNSLIESGMVSATTVTNAHVVQIERFL